FNRIMLTDGRDVFWSGRLTTNKQGGREVKTGEHLPAGGRLGHLRITRVGKKAVLAVAQGDNEFRELHRVELGAEDITMLRLAANPGNGPNAVDLRLLDLRVRALDTK